MQRNITAEGAINWLISSQTPVPPSGDEDDLELALALSLATENAQINSASASLGEKMEITEEKKEEESKDEKDEEKDEKVDYHALLKRVEGSEFVDMILEHDNFNGVVSSALAVFYRDLLAFYSAQTSSLFSSLALSSSHSLLLMLTAKLSALFSRPSTLVASTNLSDLSFYSPNFSYRDQLSFERFTLCNVIAGILYTSKSHIISTSFQVNMPPFFPILIFDLLIYFSFVFCFSHLLVGWFA